MAAPLADRIRPKMLDDFVGQSHLLGKGTILSLIIKYGKKISKQEAKDYVENI